MTAFFSILNMKENILNSVPGSFSFESCPSGLLRRFRIVNFFWSIQMLPLQIVDHATTQLTFLKLLLPLLFCQLCEKQNSFYNLVWEK